MKTIHALLVDDEEEALATMATILEMDDFQVTTANGGQEALERLESAEEDGKGVDLMVLDLDMGAFSGIQLLMELRKRGHGLPIMVVTGHASRATVVELLRQGVTDFLDKPVHMDEFRQRIDRIARNILQRRRAAPPAPDLPEPERTRSVTWVDLAGLGLPHAGRRRLGAASQSHVVLACRRRLGYDLLVADTGAAGRESFYLSVLIKSFFDRERLLEPGARDLLRRLGQAVRAGSLEAPRLEALLVRIRTTDRVLEFHPAGYRSQACLGWGEEQARLFAFSGVAQGPGAEGGASVYEVRYACRDRLMLLGEGSEPSGCVLDDSAIRGAGTLDGTVETLWKEILAQGRERSNHDLFLLGIELP